MTGRLWRGVMVFGGLMLLWGLASRSGIPHFLLPSPLAVAEALWVGEGFEPSKSMTADLQSAPFGRSGTPPGVKSHCRLFSKMNGGGGRITRRYLSSPFGAIACGNVLSLALESNLSRRFLPFPLSANIVYACRGNHITVVNNGGGGRIRTFEVDDGRFTVCSLWPLGNPTTG